MKNLNYLMDHIFYILKKHREKTVRIYTNKIENRITFRIKTRYFLELLTPEKVKLLGSTKSKIKDENDNNLPDLEITEVVLMHCNVVNNNYQKI